MRENADNPSLRFSATGGRPRLLMVAYACHPQRTMEMRNGWRRAMLAAESCDVTVLVGPAADADDLSRRASAELGGAATIRFLQVRESGLDSVLSKLSPLYYLRYRRWNNQAFKYAQRLHAEQPFDLTHQVNFCGYREPGLLWKLGAPFVWGPVGGTQDFPLRYLGQLSPMAGVREVCRNVINAAQIRASRRVRGAAAKAAVVVSATRTAQQHLADTLGVASVLQLETGLDCPVAPPRPPRDPSGPLRVLWAGRLQPWKGFPLLARAVAQLPDPTRVQARVLGTGPCRASWRRLTERLGVADRFEWVEWPGYEETLPHYRWADAFAFTSLRDTSGTGLIESLAAGAPIVGLDHQGAGDIMTPQCAKPIPVTRPAESIAAIAAALQTLAGDAGQLAALQRGAQARAAEYDWRLRRGWTAELYARALQLAPRPASRDARGDSSGAAASVAAGSALPAAVACCDVPASATHQAAAPRVDQRCSAARVVGPRPATPPLSC
ncbi:MAG: glycosyltransferase family 4 protein [Planctomycetota bacterium]